MEIRDAQPQYIRSKTLPFETVRIRPLGDIQLGSDGTQVKRLKEYVKEGLDYNAWFLGMGDYTDFLSPSNRQKLKNAGLYDNSVNKIEKWAIEEVNELADLFKDTKGRWIGLHEGHHFYEFSDGTTTDTRLAFLLGAPFLGTCAMTGIQFTNSAAHRSVTCTIWSHHGSTGSGSILNKLEKIALGFPNADILCMAHANQLETRAVPAVELIGRKGQFYTKSRERRLVATGSFDTAYTVGSTDGMTGRARGGYAEKAAYRPTGIGAPMIRVTPQLHDTNHNGKRYMYGELDIRVEV